MNFETPEPLNENVEKSKSWLSEKVENFKQNHNLLTTSLETAILWGVAYSGELGIITLASNLSGDDKIVTLSAAVAGAGVAVYGCVKGMYKIVDGHIEREDRNTTSEFNEFIKDLNKKN